MSAQLELLEVEDSGDESDDESGDDEDVSDTN